MASSTASPSTTSTSTYPTEANPEIILYDLACTKNICFSPVVWRIRLMLNYKRIPYKTIFLEFPDIEPTLRPLVPLPPSATKYTVPTIHHLPTNTYLMDSAPIALFLSTTYPSLPLSLTSAHGAQIERLARSIIGVAIRASIMPREPSILSPRSAAYFRATREAALGHSLEELLEGDREEEAWRGVEDGVREVDRLILENRVEGSYVLGGGVSATDFFVAGAMQAARVVHEGTWRRLMEFEGFKGVYEGCVEWMEWED